MRSNENVIEWVNGDNIIACTFSQKKYINKVKRLAKTHENEVDFIENEDGSIFAHLPLKALKLNIITATACKGFMNKTEEDSDD